MNNLSNYSYLNINTTNTKLNNLSSQSFFLTNYTNLNSLNVSGITILNNTTTINSSLVVSGITKLNNNTIINGVLNINGGSPYAYIYKILNNGSLIIGDTLLNYGGGSNWNGGNVAALLLECADNTEIAVHDNGSRLASLIYYEGGGSNKLQ